MNRVQSAFLVSVVFIAFFIMFYLAPMDLRALDKIFITITIFLFATLTGFFVSKQSSRYTQIVAKITDFDGNMSYLYRSSSAFGENAQSKIADVIKKHYEKLLQAKDWDAYFNTKTTTLTDLNNLFVELTSPSNLTPAQNAFASRAYFGIAEMQKIRKNLIVLYNEKIPPFQWILLLLLTAILIFAVASIPSYMLVAESLIKAAFASAIVAVLIMLYRMNTLTFYEDMAGLSSAKDVLEIIDGKR